jgi:hypothetical protein
MGEEAIEVDAPWITIEKLYDDGGNGARELVNEAKEDGSYSGETERDQDRER